MSDQTSTWIDEVIPGEPAGRGESSRRRCVGPQAVFFFVVDFLRVEVFFDADDDAAFSPSSSLSSFAAVFLADDVDVEIGRASCRERGWGCGDARRVGKEWRRRR